MIQPNAEREELGYRVWIYLAEENVYWSPGPELGQFTFTKPELDPRLTAIARRVEESVVYGHPEVREE